jgi:hypothetical protein
MIYGRFRNPVTIKRRAVLGDVKVLDGRKPDKQDSEALANGSYVVVDDAGKERLYHLAFLRYDGDHDEISAALERLDAAATEVRDGKK